MSEVTWDLESAARCGYEEMAEKLSTAKWASGVVVKSKKTLAAM
jgi:hypothetical protein